jgi:hypothetical protein
MNNTSPWLPKFIRQTMCLAPAPLLLCALLLCVILLMQRHSDGTRESSVMLASQEMKRAPEVSTPSIFPLAGDLDAATRAIFTSPSPQPPTLGRAAAISGYAEHISSMGVVTTLQLPFERGALGEDALSEQNMSDLLAAEDLPLRIGEYEAESRSDPDASTLTGLYLQLVERAMIASGTRARLAGFACGIRICVGVLTDGNDRGYWDWRDAFSQSPGLSGSGLQAMIMSSEGDKPILRFTFSVDPYLIPAE